MYTLYIANKMYSSWSLRPWLLMKVAGIPFQERLVPFSSGSNWNTFRTFSPNGRVPCLIDGNTTIWDSQAIVEYLAEHHPGIWPADDQARAWARSATAEMHSGFGALRSTCPMVCGLSVKLHTFTTELQHDIARIDELWNSGLSRFGGPFLAGTLFGAVDAFFAPVALRIKTYQLPMSDTAMAYAEKLLALPAMQDWFRDAIREPNREAAHEADIRAAGTIEEDQRQP